jgi:hypothetical protein
MGRESGGGAPLAGGARRLIIVERMSAVALVLHLALAASPLGPTRLAPALDPGPFQARELAASSAGVLLGDALVIGAAYGTLELMAARTIQPTPSNFRTAAYGFGAAALLVPPLTAALLARLARVEPAWGSTWKAALLAFAGQVLALGAGYLAYPHFWVLLPVQLVAVSVGASLGLHWGSGPASVAAAHRDERREPADPPPAATTARAPICPDPALGTAIAG